MHFCFVFFINNNKKQTKKGHDMQFAFDFNRFTRSDDHSVAIGCYSFSCVSTYTKWKICSKTTYFPFKKKKKTNKKEKWEGP